MHYSPLPNCRGSFRANSCKSHVLQLSKGEYLENKTSFDIWDLILTWNKKYLKEMKRVVQ